MHVTIVGAGIGGLTAALSLHAAGIDVRVCESAVEMKALGFGINLQPNAARELIELGLGDDLAQAAIETASLGYYNKFGQVIWTEPRGRSAGYAWPQYAIERGDLQTILLDAVKARIGAENVLTGHHLVSFEQDDSGVAAHFVDRASGRHLSSPRSDVLVGCDGIHSAVRAQLYPDEGPPVGSGRVHWRGAVETEPFLGGRTHATMGFSDQRAVVYPMSRKAVDRERSRLSWVVVVPAPGTSTNLTWGRRVRNDVVFELFKHWNFSWLQFADVIHQTSEIYEYPEADRNPLPQWTLGRVTLLGDAAHPMRPVGAQAGSQAIIDARVLAFSLANSATPREALAHYDARRRPAMNAVVVRNREFGPTLIMELAEQRAPQGFNTIEDVISRRELEEISLAYKTEAGFDPVGPQSTWHTDRLPRGLHDAWGLAGSQWLDAVFRSMRYGHIVLPRLLMKARRYGALLRRRRRNQSAKTHDQVIRNVIDYRHQIMHLIALEEIRGNSHSLCIRLVCGVSHRLIERGPQRSHTLGRHSRRDHDRIRHFVFDAVEME